MRTIKFRVWDKEEDKWRTLFHEIWNAEEIMDKPARFAVQQFTGVLDSTGKEIYEGDLVKVELEYQDLPHEVVFESCAWILDNGEDWDTFYLHHFVFDSEGNAAKCRDLKVVGNVF